MKALRHKSSETSKGVGELATLRARLADTEAALLAIRTGEVDAVVVAGKGGPQVFTLQGAEHAYRVLIESMNEGALTLTADKTILYANQRFARMVHRPLEQVMGNSLRRFLSVKDRLMLRALIKRTGKSGAKVQVLLDAGHGLRLPVQISIRPLAKRGSSQAAISMVVTDQTEARRTEEMLRALSHHIVEVQEAERGRIALELHDHITQPLCAVLARCETLSDTLSGRDLPAKREARELSRMLGETAEEVERISRGLRPGVLELLGLVPVLRDAGMDFAQRTGVPLKFSSVELTARLTADIELALYRIYQEALKNIEKHADAHHVNVQLSKRGNIVHLVITDDGGGFDPDRRAIVKKGRGGLGLLGMRERATYVGGTLKIVSTRHAGTKIDVRIPLPLLRRVTRR